MSNGIKKKIRRNVTRAIANIKATFNNTSVTISDVNGETICWASAGTVGFKGSRKSTPFAAQKAASSAADKAQKYGVQELKSELRGLVLAVSLLLLRFRQLV